MLASVVPDTRSGTPGADRVKVKGTITWVGAHDAVPAELRLYDRLFTEAQPDAVEALLRTHGIQGPIYRVSPNDPAALQALKAVLLGVDATAKECLS